MKNTGQAGRPSRKESASNTQIVVRMTKDERSEWKQKAEDAGYKTLSDMIRTMMAAA